MELSTIDYKSMNQTSIFILDHGASKFDDSKISFVHLDFSFVNCIFSLFQYTIL